MSDPIKVDTVDKLHEIFGRTPSADEQELRMLALAEAVSEPQQCGVVRVDDTRRCLACKGTTYHFNYQSLRHTSERCGCCTDGRVPLESADDGFGPFSHVQHLRTTELHRNGRRFAQTVDLHEDRLAADDSTMFLNGTFSLADLDAICALMRRVKQAGKNINCECCKWGRFDGTASSDSWDEIKDRMVKEDK